MTTFYKTITSLKYPCLHNNQTPLPPGPPAPAKSSQPSAADILGLHQVQKSAQPWLSLELEVDQYLSNPSSGKGILSFWQVVYFFYVS